MNIQVDCNSELGKIMSDMDALEENNIIDSCRIEVSSGKKTKQEIIKGLNKYMMLFGGTRSFTTLKAYIRELQNSS